MNLIYIQIIICHFIICIHTTLYTQSRLHTHCPSLSILLGHPLLAIIGFCFLLSIHCLAHCWFSLPECFCLVQNNDCAQRNDASTCMVVPMTRLTDQLNWIHMSDLLPAALLVCFALDFFLSCCPHIFCSASHQRSWVLSLLNENINK